MNNNLHRLISSIQKALNYHKIRWIVQDIYNYCWKKHVIIQIWIVIKKVWLSLVNCLNIYGKIIWIIGLFIVKLNNAI